MSEECAAETEALALFANSPPAAPEHSEVISRAIVDTVACALAGTRTSAEQILRAWVSDEAGRGESTIWATGEATAPSQAALLNATAAHALDWDDVSPSMPMHPSAVLIPALFAAAEDTAAVGIDVVGAYDVGAGAFRAIAEQLPHDVHYDRGWHTTSTVGRLAAVAALARLRRLGVPATRHALGLVASLAAGSLANFGTMTKPLHAGAAARDAVVAVSLAARGFTANPGQLEDRGGFFDVFGARDGTPRTLSTSLARWLRDWPTDWALKRYPACYATHRAVDAALRLRTALNGRQVALVRVTVGPSQLRPLLRRVPRTPDEARFSMEYAVATALQHGDLRLRRFSETGFADPAVWSLIPNVAVCERAPTPAGVQTDDEYAVVTVRTSAGDELTERVEVAYGDARAPMTEQDLATKLADCCRHAGMSTAQATELSELLGALARCNQPVSLRAALARFDRTEEVGE